jgi:DNA repair protein RadC
MRIGNLQASRRELPNHAQNSGHRQRLIKKLIDHGSESFYEYEILEMLLYLIFKRQDTKSIAKELLAKFGSISDVLNASRDDLMQIKGIGKSTYTAFQIIMAALKAYLKNSIASKKVIYCFEDVVKYCQIGMKNLKKEELKIIFLNIVNEIIHDEVFQKGTLTKVNLCPREIVKKCIERGAKSIILIHNHPSGDPTPSAEDIFNTAKIAEACSVFGIDLRDHIIIGDGTHVSFRRLRLL